MTLSLALGVLAGVAILVLLAWGRPLFLWALPWQFADWIAIVLGGGIVRTRRLAATTRLTGHEFTHNTAGESEVEARSREAVPLPPTKMVLTNFGNDVTVEIELQAMMRKPHADCFPTPAATTRQGAGEGTFM